jgi:hypothetical protein
MRALKDVETGRKAYHANPTADSVHRSSLTAPRMAGSRTSISLLNHFLLKRGYPEVGCRVTAVDAGGKRIESRLHRIHEPRVYTFPLEDGAADAHTYLIEFYAAQNLFIPFPAVMVNHEGDDFLNVVHSYNRVLNDVFEDDSINGDSVAEAAVDVATEPGVDTFLVFAAGQTRCSGVLDVELASAKGAERRAVQVDVPRFGSKVVSLAEIMPNGAARTGGVIKVRQPKQFMFFGRMLAGQRTASGAFSANHSYYDSSDKAEYWEDGRASHRVFPFFHAFENELVVYPIMSPGTLQIRLGLHSRDGKRIGERVIGSVTSPGGELLRASANQVAAALGVDVAEVSAFSVTADAGGGPVPTRVNHQLVWRAGGLPAAVIMALSNPNVFTPAGKKGFAWGQLPTSDSVESRLGIVTNGNDGDAIDIELAIYDESGELSRKRHTLSPGAALEFSTNELVERTSSPFCWYTVSSPRSDIAAYSVTRHKASGHCSGEHNF